MQARLFQPPTKSYFLFGPRGTGKSTWLKSAYADKSQIYIDLLKSREFLLYKKDPGTLREQIEAEPAAFKRVIIDEIQKLPEILDEIQSLMLDYPNIQFVLTGSSARKLKTDGANLLAGRALSKKFFPLTAAEVNFDFELDSVLNFGLLPNCFNLQSNLEKFEYLESYCETYLDQEIKLEALVRDLDAYLRFLAVACQLNGQILNVSNVSRETGVKRNTVENYYQITEDTLVAYKLEAFQTKLKLRELSHPKMYFFDTGVCRALSGSLRMPLQSLEKSFLFENFILNEIRAYSSLFNKSFRIKYWAAHQVGEVDCIIETPEGAIGVEFKYSKNWDLSFGKNLSQLLDKKIINQGFVIYIGEKNLKKSNLYVFNYMTFLKKLFKGELF